MKSLRILLCAIAAATIASTLLLPAQTANIYNRYGMALVQESDGSYTIKNAEAYVPLIGDPYRLPKALVPYKASVPAYKKAIMETVSSETII